MLILHFVLLLFVPWTINLFILLRMRLHAHRAGKPLAFWNKAFAAWACVLIAFSVPAVTWTGLEYNSVDTVRWLLYATTLRVGGALVHVLRYVLPFAAYPLVVFWFKLLVDYSVGSNGDGDRFRDIRQRQQHRLQAQLITFALKVIIVSFVFFDMITSLGIPSDKVLQMGTIFGIGLSWATSDWLRSLWASFMLAFTTDLTVGSEILLGNPSPNGLNESSDWLRVQDAGLIFTICISCSEIDSMDKRKQTVPSLNPIIQQTVQPGFADLGFGPFQTGALPMLSSAHTPNSSKCKHLPNMPTRGNCHYIPNSVLLGSGFVHRNTHTR
jgi:small-conductance mechanosensitive channel